MRRVYSADSVEHQPELPAAHDHANSRGKVMGKATELDNELLGQQLGAAIRNSNPRSQNCHRFADDAANEQTAADNAVCMNNAERTKKTESSRALHHERLPRPTGGGRDDRAVAHDSTLKAQPFSGCSCICSHIFVHLALMRAISARLRANSKGSGDAQTYQKTKP